MYRYVRGLGVRRGNVYFVYSRRCPNDVTFLAHIRGGGLNLIQWEFLHNHEPDIGEAEVLPDLVRSRI
jgi:hypothetical protein